MSEMEAYTGKLKPTGKTLTETMGDVEFPSYYDKEDPEDVEELFRDTFNKSKILIDGQVYDVEKTSFEEGDIFKADKNDDGTIDFVVRYYNGGCCFDEAIETAIKRS